MGRLSLLVALTGVLVAPVALFCQICPATFEGPRAFPVGDAMSIGTADFNGDGINDLAVTAMWNDSIFVLLGNRDGTFGRAASYGVGSGPVAVACSDVNGDGIPDLVTANNWSDDISVLVGTGKGTFRSQGSYVAGQEVTALDLGDLDGDGTMDAVVAVQGGIAVLLGNGNGSFQSPVLYGSHGSIESLAIADLDRDGDPDVAAAEDDVAVFLGNGDGTFQPAQYDAPGLGASAVAVADLDGDGAPDLAVADFWTNDVSVLLGNGDGTFGAPGSYAVGTKPVAVRVADMDGDGSIDLVVACGGSQEVAVLKGNGNGSFQSASSIPVGWDPTDVEVVDVDRDSVLDLAVGQSGQIAILRGLGNGSFDLAPAYPAGNQPLLQAVADVDRDGHEDIVVTNVGAGTLTVLRGNGDGTFRSPVSSAAGVLAGKTVMTDLNGDPFPDAVIEADFEVALALGNGNGSFSTSEILTFPEPVESLDVGDFDGDGAMDAALVYYHYYGSLELLFGNGDGTVRRRVRSYFGCMPTHLAVSDVDLDSNDDLVIFDDCEGKISVLLGNGDGTFRYRVQYRLYDDVYGLALARIGKDRFPDILLGQYMDGVAVRMGRGDGTFRDPITNPSFPSWLPVNGDFNADGLADIAFSGPEIATGDGSGHFYPVSSYVTGKGSHTNGIGDFNEDGLPDLAVANTGSNDVAILLNSTTPCPSAADFLVGQGLAAQSRNKVKLFDASGGSTGVSFLAYGAAEWGVNVAAGFVATGGDAVILTGPGPGPVYGPHVRGFVRDGKPMARVSFYAYGTLRYGVNVAAGSVDADGFDEILTGAGPGEIFGPHVRGFNFDDNNVAAMPGVNFFAYGSLESGANVAVGDVEGDGFGEILTAPGAGRTFSPQVRGFDYDGKVLRAIAGINFNAFSKGGYGAVVAGGDVDGDGHFEIAAAPGPGRRNRARFLGYRFDGKRISWLQGFDVSPFGMHHGGRVALEDMDGDGLADLITGPGPDPAATARVESFDYTGNALTKRPAGFTAFTGSFGVNVAAGSFGW